MGGRAGEAKMRLFQLLREFPGHFLDGFSVVSECVGEQFSPYWKRREDVVKVAELVVAAATRGWSWRRARVRLVMLIGGPCAFTSQVRVET